MAKYRPKLFLVLFSIFYWVLVAFYYVAIRYSGLGEFAPPNLNYTDLLAYSFVVGFSIGLLFGLFPLSHLSLFKKRKSFSLVVLIGTSCYILFFIAVIFFTSWYGNSIQFALRYVFSGNGLTVLFHLSVSSLLYHFILQINKKFGPGVLLQYAFGRYFKPKVEERAFMFLDLKSSTQIAELLKHVSYSRFVQDCYAELTEPLLHYRAQIYQYVGDEVVISWKMNRFFSPSHCYQFFFAFRERIEAKKNYFLQEYGLCPQFKAGVHCGKVTIAEVGELKTEIAFHGDVVNTASRIQSLCNNYGKELLVSESFLLLMPSEERTRAGFVVDATLRGKEASTKVFTIENS